MTAWPDLVNMPSQARLRELFDYSPGGYFIRRMPVSNGRKGCRAGDEARGTLRSDGYRAMGVDGRCYQLHRLIFMWHYGWCPEYVDHEDRNPSNCRVGNLRPATNQENCLNQGVRVNNTTGFKGVVLLRGRFRAQPQRYGRRYSLGYYDTARQAAAAIQEFDERGALA